MRPDRRCGDRGVQAGDGAIGAGDTVVHVGSADAARAAAGPIGISADVGAAGPVGTPLPADSGSLGTTVPADDIDTRPDLVGRDFTARTPGLKWVGDITYIRTWVGFVYLATVLDCCTKKVVGYAMVAHMRTSLVRGH